MKIAIFVSGNGTNCENIIRYFKSQDKGISVSLVLSNKQDAYALTRAQRLNVPTKVLSKAEFNEESVLMPVLEAYDVDFIVLAGFLLMIPEYLIDKFEHRIVNIHPSLLPKFGGKGMYGRHVHEAVKASGETETGITVHYVSKTCDGGEIISQISTPISSTDNVEDIERKVHVLEQKHYPQIIESVIQRDGQHFH